jgi:hypothetical protein
MQQLTTNHLTELLTDNEPPCISLYQPTYRHHPDNLQDPIRYQNLLTEMEESLQQKYPKIEVQKLLEKFEVLRHDLRFWNHRTDGLAIFCSFHKFRMFELQSTVPELLVVADSFHTKPLLRILQSAGRYQILALNRHKAKLYEGNAYTLDLVELTDVPSTIEEVLGEELTEQHLTVASYGAGAARKGGDGVTPSIHASGDKKDEVDIDRDRFFRSIDRGVLEHHSRPSGLPLVLAALSEHHAPFHAVSQNPFLMSNGIMMNSDSLDLVQLQAKAWHVIEPHHLEQLAELVEDYNVVKTRLLSSDDLGQVAKAASTGRVKTLLVEEERKIPGKIDRATGQTQRGKLSDPQVDDVLDDLAELVLGMKGSVVILPAAQMPSSTGVAATYRF